MKATVDERVIAQSDEIVSCGGYQYFLRTGVRMEWLEKVEKTEHDLRLYLGGMLAQTSLWTGRQNRLDRSKMTQS